MISGMFAVVFSWVCQNKVSSIPSDTTTFLGLGHVLAFVVDVRQVEPSKGPGG